MESYDERMHRHILWTGSQVLWHFVLQCVAVCCSVLRCVAVCCSVVQCVAVCCSALQCVTVCEGIPWHIVSWLIDTLLCVAVCCSVLQCVAAIKWYSKARCIMTLVWLQSALKIYVYACARYRTPLTHRTPLTQRTNE